MPGSPRRAAPPGVPRGPGQNRRGRASSPAIPERVTAAAAGGAAPHRGVRDCCYYHRQDFHAIAAAVNAIHRQLRRSGLDGDDADELMFRLLDGCGLSEDEHSTAMLLLAEDCGIQISRSPGERRWTYDGGRHRARALMDAGVHRILITVTDDRRSRD